MRILSPVPRLPRVGLACVAAVVLFSACGGEADPATDTSPATTSPPTTSTTLPPPATTVPPTTTVPSTTVPEASEEVAEIEIGPGKVWGDVFEMLAGAEQSCVRDAVGGDLDRVLRQEILDEDEINQQELALLPCLPPQVIRAVFLAGMMLGMEDDGVVVSEEQEACLREVVDEMDVSALVASLASDAGASDDAAQAEDAAQLLEMMAGLLRCLPDLFHAGVDEPDDYDGFDDYADGVEGASSVVLGEVVEGVLDYQGDVDFFGFKAVEGEVYEIDVALGTSPDSAVAVYDSHGMLLAYNDDQFFVGGYWSDAAWLVWRAPSSGEYYLEVSGPYAGGGGSYLLTVSVSDVVDDFADGIVGAGSVVLGEVVEGVLDFWGDGDWFVFEAVEGEVYEMDVALGTSPYAVVRIYDSDGMLLAFNDSRVEYWTASRMVWEAPAYGEFYVEVAGYYRVGGGSYILTVSVSDIVDDFADRLEGASSVVLGEVVEGVLDFEGDVDRFVFEAVEGVPYDIDFVLVTLSSASVGIYDSDERLLPFDLDHRPDKWMVWRAPASGEYYVSVSSHDEGDVGSYLLTVSVSDVVDDFADGLEGAGSMVVGEAVEGVLDFWGDADFFVFEAVEGELYEIDVASSLWRLVVKVYDSDGMELAYHQYEADALASRLVWEAPASGEYYVEVSGDRGYGVGSYILTVGVSTA